MITISVDSDEEQWAIGTALVNGALAFGNWPFEVRRVFSGGPGGGGGYSAGGASGSAGVAAGGSAGAGGGGSYPFSGAAGSAGGGGARTSDQRWTFGSPLRSCCATMPGRAHLDGCDETG